MEASEKAAQFGEKYQADDDDQADRNMRANRHLVLSGTGPKFKTNFRGVQIGSKMDDTRIFDKYDSNFLKPLTETRSNKPLKEILIEGSTSRIRLLPGEGLPPTPAPPTRPPNRFVSFNEPVKESERSKNSQLGTIFDDHRNSFSSFGSPSRETLSKDLRSGKSFKKNNPRASTIHIFLSF